MHEFLLRVLSLFDTVVLWYFLVANAVYSVLMVLSLYAVTLHARYVARTGYADLVDSPVTPPIAILVPAYNEQEGIVQSVRSLLALQYPEKEVIVVDDGSSDATLTRLITEFRMRRIDLIYRPSLDARSPLAFYTSPDAPDLLVVHKENGGRADAINVGINLARSPYFCTVDADSIVEPDALLRLIAPVLRSTENVVVSGGVVRIANGCTMRNGRIVEIGMPRTWLERCQVVEYIRTFLFGRPGWNVLRAIFVASGAFTLFHTDCVRLAGGFSTDTVCEDVDIIAKLHRSLRARRWRYRMVFTTDPVCWTECPRSLRMLARQRRRWSLGLMQTVVKHQDMMFNPRYGLFGMVTLPFHAYIEGLGAVIEALGTLLVPLGFLLGAIPLTMFALILMLAICYGTMLSIGSVLLEETTLRRYPRLRHAALLVLYGLFENLGYRQINTFFRAQGVFQYFRGQTKWEAIEHVGVQVVQREAA